MAILTPAETVISLLLPFVMAGLDRGIGGMLRRSITVACALAAAIALGLAGFGFLALIIAVWLVYRTLPWRIGGSITPRTPAEIAGAFARHALPVVAVPMAHVWFAPTPLSAALPFVVYAAFATGLGIAYARHVDDLKARGLGDYGDFNDGLETARGGLFGAAVIWALMT